MRPTVYKTLEDFKQKAEFFKKGQTLPARILKAYPKGRRVIAGCDQYAVPTPRGYVLFGNTGTGLPMWVVPFAGPRGATEVEGSRYHPKGSATVGHGNAFLPDEDVLHKINAAIRHGHDLLVMGCA